MWSDPDEVDNWAVSPRGAGWLFGGSVTREVRVDHYFRRAAPLNLIHIVQSRQLTTAHRTRTSTGTRRVQVHVRRAARYCLVRAKLLLPMREHGFDPHDSTRRGAIIHRV